MSDSAGIPGVPLNFLALPYDQSRLDRARVVLIPIPYDSTTSFRSGARDGPNAIIQASNGLEDYDWELDVDVSQVGIHTTAALEPHMGGPDLMVQRVKQAVAGHLGDKKLIGLLGGEHSVAIGAVQAFLEAYPDLSVLYLDAHADLRDEYLGTPWGHASGARRIHELCPLVLAGLRAVCQEERDFIESQSVPAFGWPPHNDPKQYNQQIVSRLNGPVYISVDLDVLDPSIMPAVGTPEPGGMDWIKLTGLLKDVAQSHHIVGFDVCELSPGDGPPACSYTAAKLVYKLAAYATAFGE
ncbi:MAG: agmatinase [SAR202 cluster bacterium Io17-Chloro-G9]|nr:MAG: agmatinase [SAR202 cluster bacterium Io17-Chloro-G9]